MPKQPGSGLAGRVRRELDALRDHAQLRTLDRPEGVNLCSNDYLGLAMDPRLKQAVLEAVGKSEAMGSTGSRLLSGNAPEWERIESEFAEFAGTESALYFGSGYAANIGLLSSILGPDDVVFSDASNHASIIDGIRLSGAAKSIYPHADLTFLERALRDHSKSTGAKVIVTESVFSMEGDVGPLDSLLRLAREYGAEVVVDEAHATGVLGPKGRGLAAGLATELAIEMATERATEVGVSREILAVVHTCGKALGSAGAFVCCDESLKQYLVNRARTFIFSTAMPPYLAGQIRAAVKLAIEADARRAHLGEMSNLLRRELARAGVNFGLSTTQIVPVFCGTNEAALHVAEVLRESGFAVRAIRPPTVPAGTARVRLSLTAQITEEEISRLARCIRAAFEFVAKGRSTVHAQHAQ
jgi:8-amino-7-oxononanoate synthase